MSLNTIWRNSEVVLILKRNRIAQINKNILVMWVKRGLLLPQGSVGSCPSADRVRVGQNNQQHQQSQYETRRTVAQSQSNWSPNWNTGKHSNLKIYLMVYPTLNIITKWFLQFLTSVQLTVNSVTEQFTVQLFHLLSINAHKVSGDISVGLL